MEIIEKIIQKILDIPSSLYEQFFTPIGSGFFYYEWVIPWVLILLGFYVFKNKDFNIFKFFKFMWPKEMYTKPSFKVDVQFYLMDLFKIRAFLITMIFVFTREPFLQFIDSDSFTKSFLIDDAITSTNLKAFVSFTIFLLGYEFGYYWVHRLSHKFNLLWELHQVHHYSSQMNIFVGARAHVLDDVGLSVVPYFTGTLALSLLFSGLDRETMLSASLFLYSIYWVLKRIIARLAHSHVHFSLGFLDYIFVSPRMHNGHHSREYHDLNFGQTLAIWDLVFGTFWRPPQKINYGVAGIPDDYYKNWLDCQVKPLKNIYLKLTKKINS